MRLFSNGIVFHIFLLLKFCKGDEEVDLPYDFPDKNAETVVCEAMEASPNDMKVNVSGPMEYEDALKLMSWNIKNDFKSASTGLNFGSGTDWKRPILDAIFDIFTKSCPAVYVPREFLTVIKQLNLVYQNSIENKVDNSAKWQKILEILNECSQKVKGGEFSGRGRVIERIALQGSKGQHEVMDLKPPEELADNTPQIDLIIDPMWFAFSNSYAACYKKLIKKSNSASNIKKLFFDDFLKPISHRWMEVGPGVDFGIIVGDYNIDHILMNMRHCVTGTYIKHGIVDRQLIRPIELDMNNDGTEKLRNKKTGRSIFG